MEETRSSWPWLAVSLLATLAGCDTESESPLPDDPEQQAIVDHLLELDVPMEAIELHEDGSVSVVDDGGFADQPTSQAQTGQTDDLVWWRNRAQVHYWRMSEGSILAPADMGPWSPGLYFRHVGVGDIDGNGYDDIIWQHVTDGHIEYWPISAGQPNHPPFVSVSGPVDPQWTLSAVGDIDGDGTDDLIWRNADGRVHYWPMQNGVAQGGLDVSGPVGAQWTLEASGDVDGDGTDDLIWQHDNGQVHFWPMNNGVQSATGRNISAPVHWSWTLEDAGDVDGDGTDDIVWVSVSGQAHFWRMFQGVNLGGTNIGTPVPVDPLAPWRLIGVGNII